jgi:hypothetical protein
MEPRPAGIPALERLEPYFRARKAHGKTYSRNPKKQFAVELPVEPSGIIGLESPLA